MLADEPHGLEVHIQDVVPRVLGQPRRRGIACTDSYIVMENVNTPEDGHCRLGDTSRGAGGGDIAGQDVGLTALLGNQRPGLLGRITLAVDDKDMGPFLGKADGRGTPVADGRSGSLSCSDHDGGLSVETTSNPAAHSRPLRAPAMFPRAVRQWS